MFVLFILGVFADAKRCNYLGVFRDAWQFIAERFTSSEYRNLYRFAYPQVLRVELAFLTYQTFQDTESKAYVHKFGKLLATRLVAIKADKDLQALLSAGLLSKTALSAAREEAENTGNAIAQAYLLQETKSTSKKSTFSL